MLTRCWNRKKCWAEAFSLGESLWKDFKIRSTFSINSLHKNWEQALSFLWGHVSIHQMLKEVFKPGFEQMKCWSDLESKLKPRQLYIICVNTLSTTFNTLQLLTCLNVLNIRSTQAILTQFYGEFQPWHHRWCDFKLPV